MGLRLFPNSQKDWKLLFVNIALVGLFPARESDGILGFFNVSLACTSKFLPIHQRVGKLVFLSFTYFHILSDCKDSLLVCV